MRLWHQVYLKELNVPGEIRKIDATEVKTEQLFWEFHELPAEVWKQRATVYHEQLQFEGVIYQTPYKGKDALKTEVIFKNQSLQDIYTFIKNLDKTMNIRDDVKEFIVVERRDGYPSVFYGCYALPMLMTDRDSVSMMLRI